MMPDETVVSPTQPYMPTRMVVAQALRAPELDVFGEPVQPEERFTPAPCRTIPVTEEMRRADAARRAQAVASPAWALKRELQPENLLGAKPAVVRTGRVAEAPGRVRTVALRPPRPPKAPPIIATGRTPQPKPCQWCGERVLGYLPHRRHEQTCPKRVRLLKARPPRARKPPRPPTPPKSAPTPLPCLTGCGRWLATGRRRRPDGLCAVCGDKADRRAARQRAMPRCLTCNKAMKRSAANPYCRDCTPKTIWLKSRDPEEYALNQAWAALSCEDKAAVMDALAEGAA